MIQSSLFRRHFLMVIGVLGFFVLWGLLVNHWLMKVTRENRPPPPLNTARFLAAFANGDYVAALKKVEANMEPGGSRLSLWDHEGHQIYPTDRLVRWPRARPPGFMEGFRGPPPPEEELPAGGPDEKEVFHAPENHLPTEVFEQRMVGEPPSHVIVRLPGEPATYLLHEMRWKMPSGGLGGPWVPLGVLTVTILLGGLAALLVLYRSFDGMVALADQVITDLQNGNLKARFPIRRTDEIGRAMMRFNTMADEIERLVEQVRQIERSRMTLLQDLAHDLRTPVASLRTLIETLNIQREKLPHETQEEILRLAQAEVGYFEKLVEDLLFLARVGEPRYQVGHDRVNLAGLIREEGTNANSRSESSKSNIVVESRGPGGDPTIGADDVLEVHGDEQLLRRVLRNGIENAKSFAKSKVLLRWEIAADGKVDVFIEDDGAGFHADVIESFGERRISRRLEAQQDGRISLGLGSVIMKTVIRAHGGDLKAANESSLRPGGAQVQIRLPRT
ncbi:MAG: HAMP domain-containing histidine kinase [Bdellovibrionaceae bacterium]|nr:HAMP domain-containing histidine kinase [Pseudobdellovibrionaceae bacterium]